VLATPVSSMVYVPLAVVARDVVDGVRDALSLRSECGAARQHTSPRRLSCTVTLR
jgi:hypothetical protein